MAIVISRAIVLSAAVAALGGDRPVIGWDNRFVASGVTADSEAAGFPASNLANPSTAARWQSASTADQYVTFAISGGDPIDYIGIARHNLGSAGVNVSVEIPDEASPGDWIEIFPAAVLAGDAPALLRFEAVFASEVRLRLQPVGTAPRIAVVYVGKLLVLPVGFEPGLVPLPFAANDEIATARSESGDFLGRIVTDQKLATAVSIQYLDDAWFRANMGPFVRVARTRPFFFAWMPATYPADVGYAWLESDLRPQAVRTMAGVKVHLNLQIAAVSL